MRFRHLDYPAESTVVGLGAAALDSLLERGDLGDWQPLARVVARDPWGDVAERVLQLCDAHQMYGTSELWRTWINHRRERTGEPITLAAARKLAGLTQTEVASRLGISQADVSKLEHRSDVRLSTLQSYFRALGAELRISAVLPGETSERLIRVVAPQPSEGNVREAYRRASLATRASAAAESEELEDLLNDGLTEA